MADVDLKKLRLFGERLVRDVGANIRSSFYKPEDIQISYKSRSNLVTNVDFWAEETLTKKIHEVYPDHFVVGEESVDALLLREKTTLREFVADKNFWLLDPLDGTTNFINGIPIVGVSLAYLVNGERQVGIIYDLMHDEVFSAAKGQGATRNSHPICVSQKKEMIDAVIALGYPHTKPEEWGEFRKVYEFMLKNSRAIRRFGSSTIEQCWVACGRLDGICEFYMKPWDVGAGTLIMEEAGACLKNCEDKTLPFDLFGTSVIASGSELFPDLFSQANQALNFIE